jgi:hypothetical protein
VHSVKQVWQEFADKAARASFELSPDFTTRPHEVVIRALDQLTGSVLERCFPLAIPRLSVVDEFTQLLLQISAARTNVVLLMGRPLS